MLRFLLAYLLTAHNPRSDTLATGCRAGVICLWKDGVARRFSGKQRLGCLLFSRAPCIHLLRFCLSTLFFQGDTVSGDSTIVHKAGIKGLSFTKGTLFSIGIDSVLNTLDVSTGVSTMLSPAQHECVHEFILCRQKVATSTGIGGAGICLASARSQPGTFVYAAKGKKLTLVVGGKVKHNLVSCLRSGIKCIYPTHIDPTRRRRAARPYPMKRHAWRSRTTALKSLPVPRINARTSYLLAVS